jgi:hypothetical protein
LAAFKVTPHSERVCARACAHTVHVYQQQMRVVCMNIHGNFEMVKLHYNDWLPEVMKGYYMQYMMPCFCFEPIVIIPVNHVMGDMWCFKLCA